MRGVGEPLRSCQTFPHCLYSPERETKGIVLASTEEYMCLENREARSKAQNWLHKKGKGSKSRQAFVSQDPGLRNSEVTSMVRKPG